MISKSNREILDFLSKTFNLKFSVHLFSQSKNFLSRAEIDVGWKDDESYVYNKYGNVFGGCIAPDANKAAENMISFFSGADLYRAFHLDDGITLDLDFQASVPEFSSLSELKMKLAIKDGNSH